MTLLAETVEKLTAHGKSPSDVRWVGIRHPDWMATINPTKATEALPTGSWDDFAGFADFEYASGYGRNEVSGELVIVGNDWWLERGEYDGSEWWEFKTLPRKPDSAIPLRSSDLKED